MTIGAAADNIINGTFYGISSGREFPTLFSKKGHIELSSVYGDRKRNKNYFKPDVIESGGDLGWYKKGQFDRVDDSGLTLLSARPDRGTVKEIGTSYSAPLVANLAAKIIGQYPDLSNESVK